MRTVIFYYLLMLVCSGCSNRLSMNKNNNSAYCTDTKFYPVITNEVLRKNIIEYVDKYNNKDNEELRNLVTVNKTISGDTTSYMIASTCIGYFVDHQDRVNLMTKVGDIYVGYYDNQINDVRMTVEGVVNFMIGDYPFLKTMYKEYKKREKKFPDNYGYQIAAFDFWMVEGEACILKFVDEKIVEKVIFSQIGAGPTIIEKFE